MKMFKPDNMSEVNIIFQREKLSEITDILYEQELIEFFEINEDELESFDHTDLNDLSARLLKVRSCITILKKYFRKDLANASDDSVSKTLELKNDLDNSNKELIKLKDDHKRSKILNNLKITPDVLKSKDTTIGFVPHSNFKSTKVEFGNKKVKFTTYRKDDRVYFYANTKKIPFKFKEFYIPKETESNLNSKITKCENKIAKCEIELRRLANNNLENLRFIENRLKKEIEVLESKPKFKTTKNITIISGFVPTKSIKKFEDTICKALEGKCEIIIKEARDENNTPIKLSNSNNINQFEELLKMYSLPKYGEFDPTLLLFLIFPIFFGFILGDVVYGLISLIFFSVLRIKYPNLKDFMSILQLSSITSMIFGIIYGEFMGFEFHGSFYGLFERSHEPEMLLVFAIIFGIIHINLGLIVGIVNMLPNWKKALYDKVSFIILQIAVAIIYLGTTSSNFTAKIIGWLLLVGSIGLIYMGHGFIGVMEIPSFFTNILSYARLMAVGLSSVVIAILINDYSQVFFEKGFFGIIAGIILFSVGHVFNIALGNFEGFLHTLRLHYVEFFTKFYSGGGREFKPFGRKTFE